jgi:HAD superfamily hydrolase (TIGR01509 family)
MLVESAAQAPFNPALPITGVLFDFHSTLVDQGDAASWLGHALARAPHALGDDQRIDLLAFLDRIWENARVIDPLSARDRSPVDHERVFHELLVHGPSMDAALADALYAALLDSWQAYADTAPTLRALRAAGVRIGVVSNVGVSIRGVLEREGLDDLVDVVVLSCEVGAVKPDSEIFAIALDLLGRSAAETLMVGDSGHDDVGGTALGMRTLVLPRTRGAVHGLGVVVGLVEASRSLLA